MRSELWFERLFRKLHLGMLSGSVLIGFGGFALLFFLAFFLLEGEADYAVSTGIIYVGPGGVLLITLLANYSSIFVAERLDRLQGYAQTMIQGGSSVDLSKLYMFSYPLLTTVISSSVLLPLYILTLPQTLPVLTKLLSGLPSLYFSLYLGTFVWVWGYSLYRVYRMGKQPMKLKPFVEDRALGLRPFGRFSLLLTGIYLGILTILVLPEIPIGLLTLPLLVYAAGLYLVGLGLFVVPLIPLRTLMVRAKIEALSWVGPRYAAAVEMVRTSKDGKVSEELARELSTVDKIRREASQVQTWPFDTGTFVRLSAVVLSVVAILLSDMIRELLGGARF